MSTLVSNPTEARVSHVWFDAQMMHVRLLDGRELSVPLEWFPKLRDATVAQRKQWRLIGRGVGLHWEALDEDLSIVGLLRGSPAWGATA